MAKHLAAVPVVAAPEGCLPPLFLCDTGPPAPAAWRHQKGLQGGSAASQRKHYVFVCGATCLLVYAEMQTCIVTGVNLLSCCHCLQYGVEVLFAIYRYTALGVKRKTYLCSISCFISMPCLSSSSLWAKAQSTGSAGVSAQGVLSLSALACTGWLNRNTWLFPRMMRFPLRVKKTQYSVLDRHIWDSNRLLSYGEWKVKLREQHLIWGQWALSLSFRWHKSQLLHRARGQPLHRNRQDNVRLRFLTVNTKLRCAQSQYKSAEQD